MTLLKKKSPAEKLARTVTKTVSKNPRTMAAAGIAAATALGAAAWLSTRQNGSTDGIALHVEPDGDGGWRLRQEGSETPIASHDSKRRAVSAARKFARDHSPSTLAIYKTNGTVARRHIYAAD